MESCLFGEGVYFVARVVILFEQFFLLFGERVAQLVPVPAHKGAPERRFCSVFS